MKQAHRLMSLRPRTSPCLAGFIIVSHLLAAMALFFSDLHNLARMLLLVLILPSCYFSWRKLIARSGARAIVQADWLPDDSWRIIDGDGNSQQVVSWTLMLSTPALVILKFEFNHSRAETLIICPDSMDREARRQLRVRLTTGCFSVNRPPVSAGP